MMCMAGELEELELGWESEFEGERCSPDQAPSFSPYPFCLCEMNYMAAGGQMKVEKPFIPLKHLSLSGYILMQARYPSTPPALFIS